jgi:hypothetical protein
VNESGGALWGKAQKYFGGKYSSYVYTGTTLLDRENDGFVHHSQYL